MLLEQSGTYMMVICSYAIGITIWLADQYSEQTLNFFTNTYLFFTVCSHKFSEGCAFLDFELYYWVILWVKNYES